MKTFELGVLGLLFMLALIVGHGTKRIADEIKSSRLSAPPEYLVDLQRTDVDFMWSRACNGRPAGEVDVVGPSGTRYGRCDDGSHVFVRPDGTSGWCADEDVKQCWDYR